VESIKYCVNDRHPKSVLQQVDEIRLPYKDIDIMFDFVEQYPNKSFIIEIDDSEEVNWNLINGFTGKVNIIISLHNLDHVWECKNYGLKWFWYYPITSYYELKGIIDLGPSYLFLGAPLFFNLPEIKKYGIPIRAVPNICYDKYIIRRNGVCGTWIRPEDVETYEEYIDTLEFKETDLKREKELLRIYKDQKNWPGNLNLLLTNFNYDVDNRAIPSTLITSRLSCKQRCQEGRSCNMCLNGMKVANAAERYAEWKLEEQQNGEGQ
jgi:hypothetical protein